MSVGALAGIMMMMADVNMAMARYSGYKVPHMLYDGMVGSGWRVLCFNLLVKLKVGLGGGCSVFPSGLG